MLKTKLAPAAAVLGLAAAGFAAAPQDARAWWAGGYGIGIYVPPMVVAPPVIYPPPPVYVAPPVVYAPPPVYVPPPRRVWVPPHWEGRYWVQGHWA
nr:hypothetical protein [uncultured Rhodopila sp.]